MPLTTVRQLNYDGGSYAPSTRPAVVNTDHVVLVESVETRRSEPCVRIHLVSGIYIDCVGTASTVWGVEK